MPSSAFQLFNGRRKNEVLEIATVFEEVNSRPGPNTKHGLLNGALVLLVSSWEVYCEKVCEEVAQRIENRSKLEFTQLNETLRKDLLKYIGGQYDPNKNPLDEKIAMLPDGGWKKLIPGRVSDYVLDFNTPKFKRQRGKKDINGLFRLVLCRCISKEVEELICEDGLCDSLDRIVTLRGEIAHTGDAQAENRLSASLLRKHTASFVEVAAAIDVIIHRKFRSNFGFAPWQLTAPVRNALRESVREKL